MTEQSSGPSRSPASALPPPEPQAALLSPALQPRLFEGGFWARRVRLPRVAVWRFLLCC